MDKRKYQSGASKRKIQSQKQKSSLDGVKPLTSMGFELIPLASETSTTLDENTININSVPSETFQAPTRISGGSENNSKQDDNKTSNIGPTFSGNDQSTSQNSNDSGSASQSAELLNVFSDDPADWKISEQLIDYLMLKDHISQNINFDSDDFVKSTSQLITGKQRFISKSMFKRKLVNGEEVDRFWLVFSPKTKMVYCAVCKLFSSSSNCDQFLSGFHDWKNASARLSSHEISTSHCQSIRDWGNRSRKRCLENSISKTYERESKYWHELLKRVIDVILFLAQRGLAFRGENELIGSVGNGNYLGILELLSKYDSFLANHLERYGNSGRGNVSYLSSTTCEEFIILIGDYILELILDEIKKAKYFGVIVDSTPDLQHVDQLTFILRYVNPDNLVAVERFLKFIPITSHKGKDLSDTVLAYLEECGLDIMNCRSQSYDNAPNMSGKYNGVQTKIKEYNHLAEYVPCSAHSLNLVGQTAASVCLEASSFFGIVQRVYTFLSGSTHRWKILVDTLKSKNPNAKIIVVKSLSETRWAARHDAVKSLKINYAEIIETLKVLGDDAEQHHDTRTEAKNLISKLCELETVFMCIFWNDILERLNNVSRLLQTAGLHLKLVVNNMKSLAEFLRVVRSEFNHFEEEAKKMHMTTVKNIYSKDEPNDPQYRAEGKRKAKRKRRCDETRESASSEHEFTPREKFKTQTFLVVCDSLITELDKRAQAYTRVYEEFAFIFDYRNEDLAFKRSASRNLIEKFNNDLEEELENEIIHFHEQVKEELSQENQHLNENDPNRDSEILSIMKRVLSDKCFPNVSVAMRIYLSMPCSVCEGERSFSKLAHIKNEKRSTMRQERLNVLSLISIEHEFVKDIDFSVIIERFAASKVRKANF